MSPDISEVLSLLEHPNEASAMSLQRLHERILRLSEGERGFYDTLIDLRIFEPGDVPDLQDVVITKSIRRRVIELIARVMPTVQPERSRGPDLSKVYLYGENSEHQRYLNTAQIGLPLTLLRQVSDMYAYWLNKGIPRHNYQIFLRWYQRAVNEYFLGLGYTEEELPKVFPFSSSATEAFAEFVSFLPPGDIITTDREYPGNLDVLEKSAQRAGNEFLKIDVKNPDDVLSALREMIPRLKAGNEDHPVYVCVPEVSFDGTVFPIPDIKMICAMYDAVLIVDSCQAFGTKPTELGDITILSHRKAAGLANPFGAILINPELYEDISSRTGKSLEPRGTVDLASVGSAVHVFQEILGNDESLVVGDPLENATHGFHGLAGIKNIERRLLQLQKLFLTLLEHPLLKQRVEIVTLSPELSPGRISLRVKGVSAQEIEEKAALQGVRLSNLDGYGEQYRDVIRFSFSPYQSDEAVHHAIGCLLLSIPTDSGGIPF